MIAKLDQFENLDYHDEFAEWSLQSKLEESGFILTSKQEDSDIYFCTAPLTADVRDERKGSDDIGDDYDDYY